MSKAVRQDEPAADAAGIAERLQLRRTASERVTREGYLTSLVGDALALADRVLNYPAAVTLLYQAANEAAGNAAKLGEAIRERERGTRREFWRQEAANALPPECHEYGKLNDAKRDELIAARLDRDPEYQLLWRMSGEAEEAKREFTLLGDEYRRTYYVLREILYAELRRGEPAAK